MSKADKKKQYLELLEEKVRRKARENYRAYFMYTNPTLVMGKHIDFIIDEVQKIIDGDFEEDVLVLSVPPQHGKTESVTKTLPSYMASNGKRVIVAAYNDDLANEFNAGNARKIEDFNVFDVSI